MIAGAFIVGAIIAGAIVVGVNFAAAIVAGVNFVGAFVAEQLSQEQLSPEHNVGSPQGHIILWLKYLDKENMKEKIHMPSSAEALCHSRQRNIIYHHY